jgi:hypothetical protein
MSKKKNFEDLTPEDCKTLKIEFAPGCFDAFEGSQEELDELIAEITRMVQSGEIIENSQPLDLDELIEEDPEIAEKVIETIVNEGVRKLQ